MIDAKAVGRIIDEHYRARLAADPTGPRVHECGSYCGADITARLAAIATPNIEDTPAARTYDPGIILTGPDGQPIEDTPVSQIELPEGACGVMRLCERPVGHDGPHQTSVDRAIATIPPIEDTRNAGTVSEPLDRWTRDGAMVYLDQEDGSFVADAATDDDAQRFVDWHNGTPFAPTPEPHQPGLREALERLDRQAAAYGPGDFGQGAAMGVRFAAATIRAALTGEND